jgi:hypothetical protein
MPSGTRSTSSAAAPPRNASARKSCASCRSPRKAMNRLPGPARRESVHTVSHSIRATSAASPAAAVAVTISCPVQTIDDQPR